MKVITTVGTSIFEKYNEENSDLIDYLNLLKDKLSKEYDNEQRKISYIKGKVKNFVNEHADDISVCAELKSIVKIKKEINKDVEVYLLVSDTILGKVAGEIVKDILTSDRYRFSVNGPYVILGLQTKDRDDFLKEGMGNLIDRIYDIAQYNWRDVIINITGGFKATIPYLTILAQFNGCDIYYIFEDSDALIKIPPIPLREDLINFYELAKYYEVLIELKDYLDGNDYDNLSNSNEFREFRSKYPFLFQEDTKSKIIGLNPIGRLIVHKIESLIKEIYISDEVRRQIDKGEDNKKLFDKFCVPGIRVSKSQKKNGHIVYDDGDNQYRIFYRVKDEKIYVYKFFDNHDEYEKYLKSTSYNDKLIENENFSRYIKEV